MNQPVPPAGNYPSVFSRQDSRDPLTGKTLHTYRHNCGLLVKILL
jgi:hypothetical protein